MKPHHISRRDLNRLETALEDWLHTYATEFCDRRRVHRARKRISDNGSTLAYITDHLELIRRVKASGTAPITPQPAKTSQKG